MPITSYDIYWNGLNTASLAYTKVATVEASQLTYTNAEVVPGLVYKFKVLATSAVGDSSLSDQVTIKAAQKPDAPSLPTLVNQSSTEITINWLAPHDNFDSILDYKVYWDQGKQAPMSILTASTSNTLSWTKNND